MFAVQVDNLAYKLVVDALAKKKEKFAEMKVYLMEFIHWVETTKGTQRAESHCLQRGVDVSHGAGRLFLVLCRR